MTNEEIEKLFDKNLNKVARRWLPPPATGSEIIDQIVSVAYRKTAFSQKSSVYLFETVASLLEELKIQARWGSEIFRLLRRRWGHLIEGRTRKRVEITLFHKSQRKFGDRKTTSKIKIGLYTNSRQLPISKSILKRLDEAAVDFLQKEIKKEISEFDLAKKIVEIDRSLDDYNFVAETIDEVESWHYVYEALLKVRQELERELNFRKSEMDYRGSLEALDESKDAESDGVTNNSSIVQRPQKEVFYLLECILRKLGCNGNRTEQGNLMFFMSGFNADSMRQSYNYSDEYSNAKRKWSNEEKIEALEVVLKFALDNKIPNTIAQDLRKQLNTLKLKIS